MSFEAETSRIDTSKFGEASLFGLKWDPFVTGVPVNQLIGGCSFHFPEK